jgi:hypothetical protein
MDKWLSNAQEHAAIDAFDDVTLAYSRGEPSAILGENCHLTNNPGIGIVSEIAGIDTITSSWLVRQFDSVRVFPIALVLVRQNFFKPLCLPFCNLPVCRLWLVANDELLAATIAPDCSHLLEGYRFLTATFFDCYS